MPVREYPVQRQHPLLYWMTLVYIIGVPNFIQFDVTGRTHTQGILNLTSISQIAIAFLSGYVLFLTLILEKRPLLLRPVKLDLWLWIPLLLQLILATLLQPTSRLTPYSPTDKIVSLYRLVEWIIAFALVGALYSRTTINQATSMIVQLIGRASWIWIAIVWLVLPIMPSQVYGSSDELASTVSQLGGQLISPSYLATLSIAAFLYALLFFPKGLFRVLGCLIAMATILLAHTRIEQLSFLLILFVYACFFSGKVVRLITVSATVVLVPLLIVFQDLLLQYFARGQTLKTLGTLNARTFVWQASIEAAKLRPFLGYGFLAGAKNAIRDHWIYVNWTPPHAHNEFIQAMLSGGCLAVLIVALIYCHLIWLALRSSTKSRYHTFLLLLLLLFLVRSIGGSNFTIAYTRVGALFLLTFVGIVGNVKTNIQRSQQESSNLPSPSFREVGV